MAGGRLAPNNTFKTTGKRTRGKIVIKEAIMNYLRFLKPGSGRMMGELLPLNMFTKGLFSSFMIAPLFSVRKFHFLFYLL